MSWLQRPIGCQVIHVSAIYGFVAMIATTLLCRIHAEFQLSDASLFCGAACLFIVLVALSIMETLWHLDLEDEQTG